MEPADTLGALGGPTGGRVGEQVALFSPEQLEGPRAGQGFRGPAVCQIIGITYRQLDYWARTDLVTPSLRTAAGSGSQRLYSFADLLVLKVVKRLLGAGVSLQSIRVAVEHLRARGVHDLAQVTLISDGISIYECRGPDEITDLLRGGQGVFAVALGAAMREVLGVLDTAPAHLTQTPDTAAKIIGLPARRDRAHRAAG
jgi:DNA-binding transcriptional MerR regulator